MSSREYHKCMSEVYFNRGLMWMFVTGFAARSAQSVPGAVIAVLDGLMSAFHFYLSFKEGRRAQ